MRVKGLPNSVANQQAVLDCFRSNPAEKAIAVDKGDNKYAIITMIGPSWYIMDITVTGILRLDQDPQLPPLG